MNDPDPHSKIKDDLTKLMLNLYLMFCFPQVIIFNDGRKTEINYKWTDPEMEKLFNEYQELYKYYHIKDLSWRCI